MYVKEERILRYAITNKISPVGGESYENSIGTISQHASFTETERSALLTHHHTIVPDSNSDFHDQCSSEKEKSQMNYFLNGTCSSNNNN